MSTKFSIELGDGQDCENLVEFLALLNLRVIIVPTIGSGPVPNTFLDVVTVNPVAVPDSPLILYNPLAAIDPKCPQTYAVNLYTSVNQFSFDNTGVPETLTIPRVRAFNGAPQPPTTSIIHQFQTKGLALKSGLPVLTSLLYFTTFTVVAGGSTFRISVPNPPGSKTPAYPAQSNFAVGCVAEDILATGDSRIIQVVYPAGDADYFVWRKITLGGNCDTDAATTANLFLQMF